MYFKLTLKGFKLKKLVVKPKNGLTGSTHNSTGRGPGRPLAQPIEGAKKLSLSSRTVVQLVKVEPQLVEVWSRSG